MASAVNETAMALAAAALEHISRRASPRAEWRGIGTEWLRGLLGRKEWRVPCLDVLVRL